MVAPAASSSTARADGIGGRAGGVAYARAVVNGPFSPTHSVPPGGTATWPTPDPSRPAAGRLDPGLPVQVVASAGAWAQVRCSNEWVAWVDGRTLVPWGTPPAVHPDTANPVAVWLPIGGAVLVVLGALLPWFSVIESANAFDIPLAVLFDKTSTSTAPDLGWFLLPVVVVVIAPVLGAALPRPLLGVLGALPIVFVGLFLRLYASFPSPRPDLGAGLFLTLVGGGCLAIAAALPGRTTPG